jgi:RNA polymerase sigma-70 factor (ECF subfamily)
MSETRHEEIVALLTSHQQRLMFFIRSLVPHRADAEEILQEVNLFIWRDSAKFELGTDFAAWAFQIARFKIGAYRKQQARARARLSDSVVDELAQRAIDLTSTNSQRQDALEHCLQKLMPEDRQLIALRYEPQSTTESVAKSTNRSIKAIYKALNRIQSRLLECIDRTLASEEHPG